MRKKAINLITTLRMPINESWHSKGSEESTTIIDNSLKEWKYVFHYHALRVVEYFQPL